MATPDVIPGEWFVEERPGTTPVTMVLSRDSDGTRYAVAKVYTHPDGQSDLPTARLLAAAPELLEALQLLVNTLESAWSERQVTAPRFVQCQLGEDVKLAKRVIRLAREGR